MSLLRDMVGPHGLGRQAEHLLTGGPGGPIVPPPLSATRPPGRSATGGGANAGYPARSTADRSYGPGPGHAANGRFVTPMAAVMGGAAQGGVRAPAPVGVYQHLTGARTAGLGPIVNAGAAPWRLPGFGPGGRPLMALPPGAAGMWRPPPGGFIAGPGTVPGGPAGRGIPLAHLQAHQQMLAAQQHMRPPGQPGAPPGYRPMSAPGMVQYASAGQARPSAAGQPGSGAASAPFSAGFTQQQQQQHMQQHAAAQGAANGVAAVSKAGTHYLPAPGYHPSHHHQQRPLQQHGLLPPPGMPLHRPPLSGMPAAPVSGSVQAQGAWRPSTLFAAQPGPQAQPPTSASQTPGAPPPLQAPPNNSSQQQFPSNVAVPFQGGGPTHLQHYSPAPEPTVTFAAEPVIEASAPVTQQSSTRGASAEMPSTAVATESAPARPPAAAQRSGEASAVAAAVLQPAVVAAAADAGVPHVSAVNDQQLPSLVAGPSSAVHVSQDPLLS